uniref:Secreted protein n=1 Tax=Ixodes ricinus TaxID=34613 RepID=A0A147BP96_IXORI
MGSRRLLFFSLLFLCTSRRHQLRTVDRNVRCSARTRIHQIFRQGELDFCRTLARNGGSLRRRRSDGDGLAGRRRLWCVCGNRFLTRSDGNGNGSHRGRLRRLHDLNCRLCAEDAWGREDRRVSVRHLVDGRGRFLQQLGDWHRHLTRHHLRGDRHGQLLAHHRAGRHHRHRHPHLDRRNREVRDPGHAGEWNGLAHGLRDHPSRASDGHWSLRTGVYDGELLRGHRSQELGPCDLHGGHVAHLPVLHGTWLTSDGHPGLLDDRGI